MSSEIKVTLEGIAYIHEVRGDFAGTVYYCEHCSAKNKKVVF